MYKKSKDVTNDANTLSLLWELPEHRLKVLGARFSKWRWQQTRQILKTIVMVWYYHDVFIHPKHSLSNSCRSTLYPTRHYTKRQHNKTLKLYIFTYVKKRKFASPLYNFQFRRQIYIEYLIKLKRSFAASRQARNTVPVENYQKKKALKRRSYMQKTLNGTASQ